MEVELRGFIVPSLVVFLVTILGVIYAKRRDQMERAKSRDEIRKRILGALAGLLEKLNHFNLCAPVVKKEYAQPLIFAIQVTSDACIDNVSVAKLQGLAFVSLIGRLRGELDKLRMVVLEERYVQEYDLLEAIEAELKELKRRLSCG